MPVEYNLPPGAVRTITANAAPSGQTFDKWTGDISYIANAAASQTTVTMGSVNVSLTATYKASTTTPPTGPQRYVDPVNGSDSTGTGSQTSPWRTIIKALEVANVSGYTINLTAGTFPLGSTRISLNPGVNLIGAGIDVTYITTSYVSDDRFDAAIRLYTSSSASIDHTGSKISGFTLTGNSSTTRAIIVYRRGKVEASYLKIRSFKWSGVVFWSGDTEFGDRPSALASDSSFHHCNTSGLAVMVGVSTWDHLSNHLRINAQNNFRCYNNTFTQNTNVEGDNGDCIGMDWGKRVQIYNNTFTKKDTNGTDWNFFCEMFHFIGECDIYDNTFIGNGTLDCVNIMKDGLAWGLRIYRNTFRTTTSTNLSYPSSKGNPSIDIETRTNVNGLEIFENTFTFVPNPIWFALTVPTNEGGENIAIDDVWVHHNEIRQCGSTGGNGWGIWWYNYGPSNYIDTKNVRIDNNTVYGSPGLNFGIEYVAKGVCDGLSIRNNIVVGTELPISFRSSTSGIKLKNVKIQNNQCYGNDSNSVLLSNLANGGVTITYEGLSQSGHGTGNPLFVSSPTNLRLQSGSPCRNTGINIGKAYLGSAPDRGRFEYQE